MAKNKRGTSVPQNEDLSWLDGDDENTPQEKTETKVKILSLRPGDIDIKGVTLKFHGTAEVDKKTYDWLNKSFPGFIKKL